MSQTSFFILDRHLFLACEKVISGGFIEPHTLPVALLCGVFDWPGIDKHVKQNVSIISTNFVALHFNLGSV